MAITTDAKATVRGFPRDELIEDYRTALISRSLA